MSVCKLRDKAFYYINPLWLNDSEGAPIVECEVVGITETIKSGSEGLIIEVEYEVTIGFQTTTVKEDKLFMDQHSACVHGIKSIADDINKEKEKLLMLENAKTAMIELIAFDEEEPK